MKLWQLIFSFLLAAALSSCSVNNPVAPVGPVPTPDVKNLGIQESINGDTLFAPYVGATTTIPGGPIRYSWGGTSAIVLGSSAPSYGPPLGASSDLWLQLGGIAGPADYYVTYAGVKGPDSSLDYNSFTMYFSPSTGDADISSAKGVVFFARGGMLAGTDKPSFEIGISGGIDPAGPYKTYNFYSKVFGPELSGFTQWKQFTIDFNTMTQLYGQACDLKEVLTHAWGFQFDQSAPKANIPYRLDLDYIQLY